MHIIYSNTFICLNLSHLCIYDFRALSSPYFFVFCFFSLRRALADSHCACFSDFSNSCQWSVQWEQSIQVLALASVVCWPVGEITQSYKTVHTVPACFSGVSATRIVQASARLIPTVSDSKKYNKILPYGYYVRNEERNWCEGYTSISHWCLCLFVLTPWFVEAQICPCRHIFRGSCVWETRSRGRCGLLQAAYFCLGHNLRRHGSLQTQTRLLLPSGP